ncbi:sigma-70 family RNA polymerase sigma factor [Candidatus Halobeggiatoa sp. HSG11]|nr:sigma-70 family RNA polymerase sigma factor [Candidatus Halobeggiatoa sp. HSG11]
MKYDEKRILDDIKYGNQSIEVNNFFDDCGGRLLYYFKWKFQMSHQDVEDALQEATIKFIKSIRDNKFRGDCSLCTFISRITKNECINVFRKNTPIPEGMEEFCPEFLDCQICISEVLDDFEKVEQNAVERLKVVRLWFEGCSVKEIADEIIRTEGATKKFLIECRKKLETYLENCLSECNH